MQQFSTGREAKEYLIDRIVTQARHDDVPLTDVERTMLYFSETAWSLPDIMDVNAEFEKSYDDDEYEKKIAGLVGRIREGGGEEDVWEAAVKRLRDEDHYLLIMIDGHLRHSSARPHGDILRLILTAFAIVAVSLVLKFGFDSIVTSALVLRVLSLLALVLLIAVAAYVSWRILR
ncbi:MAG: hypothetical protein WA843_04440 [Candidatus Saccharimonadales bacterium]